VLWGTTGTAQALAPPGAQSLAVGALRLLVGGLALLAAQRATKTSLVIGKGDRLPILLAALCMAAYQALFFAGVRLTGVAVGTVAGIGSSPVLAGLLGWLFRGERPGWRWGIATLLAVSGCALLALGGQEIQVSPLGLLLAIGAGGAYATFSLASKNLLARQPVLPVMAMAFGLGAVLLAPSLLFQDLSWLAQPRGWAVILHLGLFATALAYLLFGQGLKQTPLATAVTLSLAEPLTAAMLGVLALGERLILPEGIGILLIFGGLIVLAIPVQAEEKGAVA
jgi:DME family drug/metabolite transporter